MALVGVLIAIPGTELFQKMQAAGRITGDTEGDSYDTDIAPKMGRKELLSGYRWLIEKLYDPAIFFARAKRELDGWKHKESKKRTIRYTRIPSGRPFRLASGRAGFIPPALLAVPASLRGNLQVPARHRHRHYYHHLFVYTREVVLPRLSAELGAA